MTIFLLTILLVIDYEKKKKNYYTRISLTISPRTIETKRSRWYVSDEQPVPKPNRRRPVFVNLRRSYSKNVSIPYTFSSGSYKDVSRIARCAYPPGLIGSRSLDKFPRSAAARDLPVSRRRSFCFERLPRQNRRSTV